MAVLLAVTAGYFCSNLAHADSSGALSPTAATSVATGPGAGPWVAGGASLLADVATSDDAFCSALDVFPNPTEFLVLSFPDVLPIHSAFIGVELKVEGYGGALAAMPEIDAFATTDGATYPFTPVSFGPVTITATTPPDAVHTLGGSLDDWSGLTTASIAGNASFGVGVIAGDAGGAAVDTYFIDHVTLEYSFTRAAYSSTGDGSWSMFATWTGGPASTFPVAGDLVTVANTHSITVDGDLSCYGIAVDGIVFLDDGADSLVVGDDGITVGVNFQSAIINSGGSLSTTGDLHLGTGAGANLLVFTGSSVDIGGDLFVNESGAGSGMITLEGMADVNIMGTLEIDGTGTGSSVIDFSPSANGSAGLTTLTCGDLILGPDVTLRFDTLYTPSAGDSWDVIAFSGTKTGSFAKVETEFPLPAGLGIEVSSAKAGTVTATIVFTGAGLPSTTNWGLIVLLATLTLAGGLGLHGLRRPSIT